MLRATLRAAGLLLTGAILATGCDEVSANVGDCQTTVDAGTSPAPGVLTLTGQFYPNETVELTYTDNGQTLTAVGTAATQRTSLTLTNLPSGTRNYSIQTSCNSGVEDLGSKSFTVQ